MLQNAHSEAEQALAQAQERIEQEREQVYAEADRQMPKLVSALARQLLKGDTAGEEW